MFSAPDQPRGPPPADSADREAYRRGPAPGMEPKGGAGSDFRPEFVSLTFEWSGTCSSKVPITYQAQKAILWL